MGTLEDKNVQDAISELSKISSHITICGTPEVPWFPTQLFDFDQVGKTLLSEADGIQMTDHPAFNDEVYKKRRNSIVQQAMDYNLGDPVIPGVKYTEEEMKTWTYCFGKLKKLYDQGACTPFNTALEKM